VGIGEDEYAFDVRKLVDKKWQYAESHSLSHSYGVVFVVVLIWTVTPHGVSASIGIHLQPGWVEIPFWKRRHRPFTIDKRHQTLHLTSKVSHDSLGFLHAT
jgi:hypothetical protein